MSEPYIQLHPGDNVLIALENLEAGRKITFDGKDILLKKQVPLKHKFTLTDLLCGDPVYMYGVLVGKATQDIPRGELIDTHNLSNALEVYSDGVKEHHWAEPDTGPWKACTFDGYHRSDGRVGTANYWLVMPLVFCENRNIEVMKSSMATALGYPSDKDSSLDIAPLVKAFNDGAGKKEILDTDIIRSTRDVAKDRLFPNVDGIKFLTHDGGCGGTREDSETLGNLLAGYITHPNVAGATILSLGCQHLQIQHIRNAIDLYDPSFSKSLLVLEQQGSKSEEEFIARALKETFAGMMEANKAERKPAPLSKLTIGLECGGSDGFSGISANPVLGYVSDMIVALGGISILSEFPELNGVEQDLIDRCTDRKLAGKFTLLMKRYNQRASEAGSGFAKNPSPGNIKDGLITNAMKSAGAARKGGTSHVTGILDYTEQAVNPGLNLLCTPGNDVESTTGLAGSGANMILFATGLGTPTGNPVCPVVKISSNTQLYHRMKDIIDFDAGSIIDGNESIASLGEKLLDHIVEVASGRTLPKAVQLGQDDFIPWKRGVSL
ncbi:MAG: altronate dehydratase [Bacteroidetes bacterium]|nr:altronate dehydratase [Bacteroidota bacterium]